MAKLHIDPPTGTLTGTVTDKADKSTMPGVSISIPDLKMGTVTNTDGKYSISNVPNGVYLVQFSFVGYGTVSRSVDFSKPNVLDIQLETSNIETAEVVVPGAYGGG